MACYLQTVDLLLLAVLALLFTDTCRAFIGPGVSMDSCPALQLFECKRGIKWSTHYAKIYSAKLDATYLCDTKTDGGGWIVFQRRLYKDTNFRQNWYLYKYGFGPACSDYWLGNELIHQITNSGKYELLIDMMYYTKPFFAQYQHFYLDGEDQNYTLHLSGFTGNTRDDFTPHDGMQFSTPDWNDTPGSKCANGLGAGWWFTRCHVVNLNGQDELRKYYAQAIHWKSITGNYDSLTATEMKIRLRDS
ncbi:Ficolin-2 [Bulinus truncatus]|nr:Ficolin-2 [Bulinus truncatus]